jgi:hypothetical protein
MDLQVAGPAGMKKCHANGNCLSDANYEQVADRKQAERETMDDEFARREQADDNGGCQKYTRLGDRHQPHKNSRSGNPPQREEVESDRLEVLECSEGGGGTYKA